MKYLITGGAGFIGSNLASDILKKGHELIVFDNLFRYGSSNNLAWLNDQGNFKYYPFDIRNFYDVERVIKEEKPDVIFHLAGQVAMTTSILHPRLDFEVNALGTFNLLEAVRQHCPSAIILYSSTNKVYGDFEDLTFRESETRYVCEEFPLGFTEDLSLNFHSPYGCSKGTADQYLLDFGRIYNIRTVVFRHSSMYGGNQHSTIDQGWIGWFCQKALEQKNSSDLNKFTISGNGKQVRDLLHANDVVSLYNTVVEKIDLCKGNAFNIGGGIENSLSLLELFSELESVLDVKLSYDILSARQSDQLVFVADNTKINELTGWYPKVKKSDGIRSMLGWLQNKN